MVTGKLPLISEIIAQSLDRTVEILNMIPSGSATEKNSQEPPHAKTEAPTEDKEDSL